jgi:hypothetical protein
LLCRVNEFDYRYYEFNHECGQRCGQSPFSEEINHMTWYPEIAESYPNMLISKKENLKNLNN